MSQFPFSNSRFPNPLLKDYNLALSADRAVQAAASPFMIWAIKAGAIPLVLKSVASCSPVVVTPGLKKKPALYLFPSPMGSGHHVGGVLAYDKSKVLRAFFSNCVPEPSEAAGIKPPELTMEAFDALKSAEARIDWIHRTISSMAAIAHMQQVSQVAREADNFKTMALYLVGPGPLLYTTVLLAAGQPQTNASLAFTGSIRV